MENEKIEKNKKLLEETVAKLMQKGKGILAADESNSTAGKRLESTGAENTEENRRLYRELFLEMPEMENYVSGVIMYDETFWQKTNAGEVFPNSLTNKGVVPGIKVDTGAKDSEEFPGEKVTEGIEGLPDRLAKYFASGARFAKWRAVIKIDESVNLPTDGAIAANIENMSKYVLLCQEAGIVPIVEPEVLLTGPHTIEKAGEVTSKVVKKLFDKISETGAHLPGIILKTSMVIQGNENSDEASPEEVANATIMMMKMSVPENVGGVVFLSGGQTAVEASAHLDAIAEGEPMPWEIAFSYARALQGPALVIWKGKDENVVAARREFLKRLKLNQLADAGDYDVSMEYSD